MLQGSKKQSQVSSHPLAVSVHPGGTGERACGQALSVPQVASWMSFMGFLSSPHVDATAVVQGFNISALNYLKLPLAWLCLFLFKLLPMLMSKLSL